MEGCSVREELENLNSTLILLCSATFSPRDVVTKSYYELVPRGCAGDDGSTPVRPERVFRWTALGLWEVNVHLG